MTVTIYVVSLVAENSEMVVKIDEEVVALILGVVWLEHVPVNTNRNKMVLHDVFYSVTVEEIKENREKTDVYMTMALDVNYHDAYCGSC